MENQPLKIKCPCCGAVLAVKNQPGLEQKSLTCPNCKTKSKFTDFIPYKSQPSVPPQPAPENKNVPNQEEDEGETCLGPGIGDLYPESKANERQAIGHLVLLPSGEQFSLELGINVIGRKASSSTADIQIPTASRLVSRRHSVIEVKNITGKGVVHYLSNADNKNDTYVGAYKLDQGDCIVLKKDDLITMADIKLRFVNET